jgi:hypothetical protein
MCDVGSPWMWSLARRCPVVLGRNICMVTENRGAGSPVVIATRCEEDNLARKVSEGLHRKRRGVSYEAGTAQAH